MNKRDLLYICLIISVLFTFFMGISQIQDYFLMWQGGIYAYEPNKIILVFEITATLICISCAIYALIEFLKVKWKWE